jgi:hypothetical protein
VARETNKEQRPDTTLTLPFLVSKYRKERSLAAPILFQPISGLVLTISLAYISR